MKDTPQYSDIVLLEKFTEAFPGILETYNTKDSEQGTVDELALSLFHLNPEVVLYVVAFLMTEYLRDHPKSLGENDGFVKLMYFLGGLVDELEQCDSKVQVPGFVDSDLLKALNSLSLHQVELFGCWLIAAKQWECCRQYTFDLQLAEESLGRYLRWRKHADVQPDSDT